MKFIDTVNDKLGTVVSFLAIAMCFIISIELACRGIFGLPTIWAHETTQLLFATYVVLGGAYTQYRQGHIRVDIFYEAFPPSVKAIVRGLSFGLFFVFCAVIIWKGSEMAWLSITLRETSTTPFEPPLYPFKALIPVAVFLMLLQGITNLFPSKLGKKIHQR